MSSLYYIQAPMNASKSAQALMVWHNYEEQGYSVLTVKPKLDTRDGNYIQSRALDVEREVALTISKEEVGEIYLTVLQGGYDVVIVDEAQFLTTEQVDELGDIVDKIGIPVMAYGLRTDSFSNLFEGSKRLFEIADKFQEFKTVCPCCGKKAIFNMRMDENDVPIFEGDQVSPGTHYLPVCRKYFKKLKKEHGHA